MAKTQGEHSPRALLKSRWPKRRRNFWGNPLTVERNKDDANGAPTRGIQNVCFLSATLVQDVLQTLLNSHRCKPYDTGVYTPDSNDTKVWMVSSIGALFDPFGTLTDIPKTIRIYQKSIPKLPPNLHICHIDLGSNFG